MHDLEYGPRIQADLVNPDFVKLAESFGIRGVRSNSPTGLRSALSSTLKSDSTSIIEVADDIGSPY